MSALFRAHVSAFLAGVAVAGVFGVYQLRGDVAEGQQRLVEQVRWVARCAQHSTAGKPLWCAGCQAVTSWMCIGTWANKHPHACQHVYWLDSAHTRCA